MLHNWVESYINILAVATMSFDAKVDNVEPATQLKEEDVTSQVEWDKLSPDTDKYDDCWTYLENLFGHRLAGGLCFVVLLDFEKKSAVSYATLSQLRKDIHTYAKDFFARKLYCFEFEKHDGALLAGDVLHDRDRRRILVH